MTSLIAIGAGIAALTGIGAGIGIGPKVLQFSVWLLQF